MIIIEGVGSAGSGKEREGGETRYTGLINSNEAARAAVRSFLAEITLDILDIDYRLRVCLFRHRKSCIPLVNALLSPRSSIEPPVFRLSAALPEH